jgi:hypothetical protein
VPGEQIVPENNVPGGRTWASRKRNGPVLEGFRHGDVEHAPTTPFYTNSEVATIECHEPYRRSEMLLSERKEALKQNGASPQSQATVITAQAFQLVDSRGVKRGRLALDHNEAPFIALHDPHGRMRLTMRVVHNGTPDIVLFDENEKPRMVLRLDEEGDPMFDISDGDGKSRVMLTICNDGSARLWFDEPNSRYVS